MLPAWLQATVALSPRTRGQQPRSTVLYVTAKVRLPATDDKQAGWGGGRLV